MISSVKNIILKELLYISLFSFPIFSNGTYDKISLVSVYTDVKYYISTNIMFSFHTNYAKLRQIMYLKFKCIRIRLAYYTKYS